MTAQSLTQVKQSNTQNLKSRPEVPQRVSAPDKVHSPERTESMQAFNIFAASISCQSSCLPSSEFDCLIDVSQVHSLTIDAKLTKEGVQRIYGQIDKVRWNDIQILVATIINTLLAAKLCESTDLQTVPYFDCVAKRWMPGIQLFAKERVFSNLRNIHQTIGSIAETALSGLEKLDTIKPKVLDMFDKNLPDSINGAIYTCIKQTLNSYGGKKISQTIHVRSSGGNLQFNGQLDKKPTYENFHPEPKELIGTFVGFDVNNGELYFTDGDKKVRISY